MEKRMHEGLSERAVQACCTWHAAGYSGRLGAVAREGSPISDAYPKFSPWPEELVRESQAAYRRDIGALGRAGKSQFSNDVFQRVETPVKSAYLRLITNVLRIIMARTNPFQFIQQTRAEITKVVWPTRREVLITTAMVLLLAIIAAIFFSGVDAVIRLGLRSVLGMF